MSKRYCCSSCDSIKTKNFHGYQIGDEEATPHKKAGKSKTKKRFKGCPQRDHKNHIYVWVEYHGRRANTYYDREVNGFVTNGFRAVIWWKKICVGCGHMTNAKYFGGPPSDVYQIIDMGNYSWY